MKYICYLHKHHNTERIEKLNISIKKGETSDLKSSVGNNNKRNNFKLITYTL